MKASTVLLAASASLASAQYYSAYGTGASSAAAASTTVAYSAPYRTSAPAGVSYTPVSTGGYYSAPTTFGTAFSTGSSPSASRNGTFAATATPSGPSSTRTVSPTGPATAGAVANAVSAGGVLGALGVVVALVL